LATVIWLHAAPCASGGRRPSLAAAATAIQLEGARILQINQRVG
jgi:hypothetical protein